MLKEILPKYILNALQKFNYDDIQEIRLRNNAPIIILENAQKRILSNNNLYLKTSKEDLENIVMKSSNFSLYSIQNQLKNGYISLKNGIRIGICGEFSYDNINLKDIQSLNIRLPHQVINCSKNIFNKLFIDDKVCNTLILSPPGAGKTTLLRDILYQFNNKSEIFNIVVVDDRNEICALVNGYPSLKTYNYCDIVSHLPKEKGIMFAIKNLNPDIIITDEISSDNDCIAIEKLVNMGVNIITTIHANSLSDLKQKKYLKSIIENKNFERYIIISKVKKVGEIIGIYDSDFNRI